MTIQRLVSHRVDRLLRVPRVENLRRDPPCGLRTESSIGQRSQRGVWGVQMVAPSSISA